MATPPPLNSQPKKKGCAGGCLTLVVAGFGAVILLGVVGNFSSDRKWKNDRPNIVRSVEQAVEGGDYNRAILLADPHQSRNDPELNALVAKARDLQREAAERAHLKLVARLVAEIHSAQGEEREKKLERLLGLEPNTKEFPEELTAIRERNKKREEEAAAKREAEHRAEVERWDRERAERDRELAERERVALEARLAEFKWKYQVTKDELTSKPTYLAVVPSINQINFDFPYQGAQRGTLMLRTHPQHGKDLIVQVEKGQMLVQSYQDTTVKVVFDGGSPISYRVVGPADHGSTSLFFRDYQGFVGKMLKAKTVKISVPFYQQGNVVFEFNVSDFDSDQYLDKK